MLPARSAIASLVLFAVLFATAACRGGGAKDEPTPPPSVSTATAAASPSATASQDTPTGTPSPTAPAPPEVVREMMANVAAGRGLAPPERLAADVISRDQLPPILEEGLTEADLRWFDQTTTLYQLLGYLDDDEDYHTIYMDFAKQAVIGLYNPLTDHLYVVTERGRGWEDLSEAERETLAHEVVHAMQDYHFALDRTFEATIANRDQNLAYTAVVEGDAVAHETLAQGRRGMLPGGTLLALGDVSQLAGIPVPIERELRFPYLAGADWIRGLKAADGTATIDELLRQPPLTTAVVLHPERGVRWAPEKPDLPDLAGALGDGWERESSSSFGEFHWMNLLQTELRGLDSAKAASAWRGDRYDVYRHGDDAVAVFRAVAEPELAAGVTDWLDKSARLDGNGETTAAAFGDGRVALLRSTTDGFILILGTESDAVNAAMDRLSGG